jgi:hypothetical protein
MYENLVFKETKSDFSTIKSYDLIVEKQHINSYDLMWGSII